MKRFYLQLLFTLSFSIVFAQQSSGLIQQAVSNYEYEKALQLIEQEESSSTLLLQKALALKGLNRFFEAADALRELVLEEPDNQRAIIELAGCCRQSGQLREALDCYEKILETEPDNKFILIQKINLLCNTEQYTVAYQTCKELQKNDTTAVPLRLMGHIYSSLSKIPEAIECYEQVLEMEPHDSNSTARLASLHIQSNVPQKAIDATENYRKIDINNLNVNRQNAQAYSLNKEYDTAIERYDYLVERGDSCMTTCYYLGMAYYAKERYYEAHTFLQKAYEYSPKNVNILYYLGKASARTSWKQEGIELLNEAINLTIPSDSTLSKLYAGLVECYKMAGQQPERIEALKEQYKYDKENHILLYTIGHIYQDILKDNKNAEKYLTRFLKTEPKEAAPSIEELEDGTIVLNKRNYYRAAEKRLEDIRKDQFFKGELSVKP